MDEDKGVSPANVSTVTADPAAKWAAPGLGDFTTKAWADLSDAEKRAVAGHFAWAASMPPAAFGDLKLPHHQASDGKVVWAGVTAAMAALMGGRGGVAIPAADQRKVYDHLAVHYKAFDKVPPPRKEARLSMATKAVCRQFELKETDPEARTFTGMAAAFSLDQGGDVILPGAFKRTIADWRKSKRILPLIDSHNRYTVRNVVGKLLDAAETPDGLQTTFQVIDGPDGDEILRRLKGGYVDGLSIGYDPIEVRMPTPEEERTGIWRFLKQVRLKEVSVVVFPMNADATVDIASVKEELDGVREGVQALLERPGAEAQLEDGAASPEGAPAEDGLAPEDPRRVKMGDDLRALELRRLGIGPD